jgi:putative membrane protein
MPRTSLVLLAACMALGATPVLADPPPPDGNFTNLAAPTGMAEAQAAQLAAQRATSPRVKQFGQRLASDDAQINQDLQQIAVQENLTLPTGPTAIQQSQGQRLGFVSGAAFDSAFLRDETMAQQRALIAFQQEALSGKDPALRDFARKTLPMLRQHLQMAQSLASQSTAEGSGWNGQD